MTCLSILVFGLAIVSTAYSLQSDVLELTNDNFASQIAENDNVLVMFFAPWCGHCKKLKPEFYKAAGLLKNGEPQIALAQVDCTKDDSTATCEKYGVTGYPSLKIFQNGELTEKEYNGIREAEPMAKFLKGFLGPPSQELKTTADVDNYLEKQEPAVIAFLSSGDLSLKKKYVEVADQVKDQVRCAHTEDEAAVKKYGASDKSVIILFRPKYLHNKFEPPKVQYEGAKNVNDIKKWVEENVNGLVGVRDQENGASFGFPIVIAYYDVDYVKNIKGTNYWRNRILKVAQGFADSYTFAVSAKSNFQHELNEYGIDFVPGDKPIITARTAKTKKFIMKAEFSVENFQKFMTDLKEDKLVPHVKSEVIPEDNTGPVTVAVTHNFDEVVRNNGKDTLIEFYAPWCGHCKKLGPVFDELGIKLKDEDVSIVKMDATANDVPTDFEVSGFPTLYYLKKNDRSNPMRYEGGRELEDLLVFLAKKSTDGFKRWDRNGNERKLEL